MANQFTISRFVSETHKECSSCNKIKTHSEFQKDKKNKKGKGLAFYCRECANFKSRKWHKENVGKIEVKRMKRSGWVKRAHGITLLQYEDRLQAQDFKCAICRLALLPYGYGTHLDHCHTTGKLRAFLCSDCNRGIGCFHDSAEKLSDAIEYLKTHSV